jgi:hypothetical protein
MIPARQGLSVSNSHSSRALCCKQPTALASAPKWMAAYGTILSTLAALPLCLCSSQYSRWQAGSSTSGLCVLGSGLGRVRAPGSSTLHHTHAPEQAVHALALPNSAQRARHGGATGGVRLHDNLDELEGRHARLGQPPRHAAGNELLRHSVCDSGGGGCGLADWPIGQHGHTRAHRGHGHTKHAALASRACCELTRGERISPTTHPCERRQPEQLLLQP